ncbi:hypothetical protein DRO59_09845 [Candidatus Bathyarchaeota archaeon]|nr:MAG: hypothetical protein DRO59_09845 [Candidatus Bathyarchaeota archaeon]
MEKVMSKKLKTNNTASGGTLRRLAPRLAYALLTEDKGKSLISQIAFATSFIRRTLCEIPP